MTTYRIDPMSVVFLVLALIAGAAVYLTKGPEAWLDALMRAVTLMAQVAPIILAAVLISGYVQTLIPRQLLERWLGQRSGWRGLSLATTAGALTPGGPFAAFPLVVALLRAGAAFEIGVAYLTAWSLLGINRALVWEIPFFGLEFVALKFLASLPLPFLAAALARPVAGSLGVR
ncbi:MAG: permease [Halorhodospira sp.]